MTRDEADLAEVIRQREMLVLALAAARVWVDSHRCCTISRRALLYSIDVVLRSVGRKP